MKRLGNNWRISTFFSDNKHLREKNKIKWNYRPTVPTLFFSGCDHKQTYIFFGPSVVVTLNFKDWW